MHKILLTSFQTTYRHNLNLSNRVLLQYSKRDFARKIAATKAKPTSISGRLEEATKQREDFM